jgi:hypothetical protein
MKYKFILQIFFIISLTAVQFLISEKVELDELNKPNDAFFYIQSAESFPEMDHRVQKPFYYRPAAPWAVGALFDDVHRGFYVITLFSLILWALLYYYFLMVFGISVNTSFLITVFFIFNRYFFPFYSFSFYYLADIFSILMIMTALIFLVKDKYAPVYILIIIGIFVRETLLFLLPVSFLFIYKRKNKKELIKLFFGSILVLILFFGFRIYWPLEAGESLREAFGDHYLKFLEPLPLIKSFLWVYSPFFALPILRYKETFNFIKEYDYLAILLPLSLFSSLFGQDNERLLLPFIPVFYFYIAKRFDGSNLRLKLIFLMLVIISSFYHLWGILLLPDRFWSALILTICGLIGGFVFYRFR